MKSLDAFSRNRLIFFAVIVSVTLFSYRISAQQTNQQLKDDASVVSVSFPNEMYAGHAYTLYIRLKNTGTTIWTPGYYKLVLAYSDKRMPPFQPWDVTIVNVRSNANSGSDVTFSFSITAPKIPGSYNFEWRMESPGGYFGEATSPSMMNVLAGGSDNEQLTTNETASGDNAAFLMQIMPNEMTPDKSYEVSVTMQNTGKSTWSKGQYSLNFPDSLLNVANSKLDYVNIVLPLNSVEPGKEVTFDFTVKAPSAPGEYDFQWIMKHGSEYFGQPSQRYVVQVR